MIKMISIAFILLSSFIVCCAAAIQNLGPDVSKYVVARLPNLQFHQPLSWAGEITMPGTRDQLFFWLFAPENSTSSDNVIVWLNGGPGCSSLEGLTSENGPLSFIDNATYPVANPYSWTKLGYVLYIDQPIGAGYSNGPNQTLDNADIVENFHTWLKVFYETFPGLKSKNTYLAGESYAGVYIPYFAAKILSDTKLNLTLKALTIGDGTLGNYAAMSDVPITTYMRQQNDILHVPQEIMSAFETANQQCGFDDVLGQLTYPPKGPIAIPGNPEGENFRKARLRERQSTNGSSSGCGSRDVTSRGGLNASIFGPCNGGCATWSAAADYLTATRPCFSVYNIDYSCGHTPSTTNFAAYLNRPSVRRAIHAADKTWEACNSTILNTLTKELVVPPAYSVLPTLLERGLPVHLYSGDKDLLLNHIGTELVIQNMTWNGAQGFQHPPNNSFLVDGKHAGNWGCERGLSYHHILGAGHAVPHDRPAAAFTFMRDHVLGNAG